MSKSAIVFNNNHLKKLCRQLLVKYKLILKLLLF